ncbi:hypothetical protein [Burkholderia alba]|uniref:hypothetical protein n=1 Tax=Burkholderia alba TaxID=2683677 RepID=UPI002B051931|nr:hypothetical protein [Burkholderia alba]
MNFHRSAAHNHSLLDDSLAQHPDLAEQTVLAAVRTWLHPDCGTAREQKSWRDVLVDAGLHTDGLDHFDMLMYSLTCASCRPLDTRCRCATDLANDEASLLQTIAHLQTTHSEAAMRILNDWLPSFTVSGVLKIARWFSISLLDAGLEIRARARSVTYMH